ncbi:hypothetical protein CQ10_37615 [Bradyrhizobium valentinum]|nr:hypothetical protein CQ10_37615 [Bradyrhizobium valentinum]
MLIMLGLPVAHGVVGHRAHADLSEVGNLLNADDTVHAVLHKFREPGMRTARLVPVAALARIRREDKCLREFAIDWARQAIDAIATWSEMRHRRLQQPRH